MIEYQLARVKDVMEIALPMLADHHKEVEATDDVLPLEPDTDRYLQLDMQGLIQVLCAWDDGKLVGYCVDMLVPHIHYRGKTFAVNDFFYVAPEYRDKGVGAEMLRVVGEVLKQRGVYRHCISTKVSSPHEQLFTSLEYNSDEVQWSKELWQ